MTPKSAKALEYLHLLEEREKVDEATDTEAYDDYGELLDCLWHSMTAEEVDEVNAWGRMNPKQRGDQ